MQIKIAIICSQAYKEYVSSIAQTINDFQIDFYIYKQPEDANKLLDVLKPTDVVVMGGLLPYLEVSERLKAGHLPFYYLEQDESSVSTTLLSTIVKYGFPLERLSIDVIKPEFVSNIMSDINHLTKSPFVLQTTSSKLFEEHLALYQQGKIDLAITSVHHIYEQLKAASIPTVRMIDSKSALLQKLSEIKSIALLNKSNANRAAAGKITLHIEDQPSFVKLTQEIHASYKQLDDNNFEIYTTSGRLQYLLASEQLKFILESFQHTFTLGFGYGESIVEALHHANEALKFSTDNQVYLLNAQSKLMGPYPDGATSLVLKNDHPKLLDISTKTKLSALNISKIIAFSNSRQSDQFTAQDLADYLFVTRRTAERTIKKLIDNQYAINVGEEMTYLQGRPRAIYILNFD